MKLPEGMVGKTFTTLPHVRWREGVLEQLVDFGDGLGYWLDVPVAEDGTPAEYKAGTQQRLTKEEGEVVRQAIKDSAEVVAPGHMEPANAMSTTELEAEVERQRTDLTFASDTIMDLNVKLKKAHDRITALELDRAAAETKLDEARAEAMDLRQRNNQAHTNYSALLQAKNELAAELRQVKTDKGNSEAELARAKGELAAIRAIIHKDMRGE